MRSLLSYLLVFAFVPLQAQEDANPYIDQRSYEGFYNLQASPADSTEFKQFLDALKTTPKGMPIMPDSTYHLKWVVLCHVSSWLTRGSGQDLASFLADPPDMGYGKLVSGSDQFRNRYTLVYGPKYIGSRYALMYWSPPTSMIRYAYWYFERDEE